MNKYKIIINLSAIFVIAFLSHLLIKKPLLDTHGLAIIFMLLIAQTSKIKTKIIFFILVLFGMYGVLGISYGYPDIARLGALLETNALEAQEFFFNIPIKNWLLSGLFIGVSCIYYYSSCVKKLSKQLIYPAILLFIATLLHSWNGKLIRDSIKMTNYYIEHKQILKESINKADTWDVEKTKGHHKYQNYVLVIGESLRQDYMGVYGYKHETTPYLSQTHGVFIDGAYSMAASTNASLSRSLHLTENNGLTPILPNNIVSLANKVDLETIWVSNAGIMGKHDSATSAVAYRSNKITFLKSGINTNRNYDDMELINILKDTLSQPQQQPRLIILHMMGSHPATCERLQGFPVNFHLPYHKDINCYLATVEKTDTFIHKAVQLLQSYGSYSLIYFSDHGVSVTKEHVHHQYTIHNNYQVPLFILSSDDKAHQVHKKTLSMIHFLDIFASWLGVATNYTDTSYDISKPELMPENNDLSVYYDGKMVDPTLFTTEPVLD